MSIIKISTRFFGLVLLLLSLNSCDLIQIFDEDTNNPCIIVLPKVGTHVPSKTQIEWNWNTVPAVSGYKYNTVDNYSTATDNGISNSYIQTGLTCNTAYTMYIWAYKDCGNSTSLQLSQNSSACSSTTDCGTVTFTYNGSTVSYGTVKGANNRCWLDRNLGATRVATSLVDAAAYGDLFQWGRLDDGHQDRAALISKIQSNGDVPGHDMYIWFNAFLPYDWRATRNDNLWQGVNGINNPCPAGYRVPTEAEWETELQSWIPNDSGGAYASPLKLTWAGNRFQNAGSVNFEDNNGFYWSSTVNGTFARGMVLYPGGVSAEMDDIERAYGFCVRCIKD